MYQKYTEGNNTFSYEVVNEDSVKVTGLDAADKPIRSIRIPEEIEGKPVVWVGILAAINFSDLRDTNMHDAPSATGLEREATGTMPGMSGVQFGQDPVQVYLPEGTTFGGCGMEITSRGFNIIKYDVHYYERTVKRDSGVGNETIDGVTYVYEKSKFGAEIVTIHGGNYPKKVEIPAKLGDVPVMAICDNCQIDRLDITESIEFPAGLSYIGSNCFNELDKLRNITLKYGAGVKVGSNSFVLHVKEDAGEDGGWSSSPLMPQYLDVHYNEMEPAYERDSFVRTNTLMADGEDASSSELRSVQIPVRFLKIGE